MIRNKLKDLWQRKCVHHDLVPPVNPGVDIPVPTLGIVTMMLVTRIEELEQRNQDFWKALVLKEKKINELKLELQKQREKIRILTNRMKKQTHDLVKRRKKA